MKKSFAFVLILSSFIISARQLKTGNVYSFLEKAGILELNETDGHTVCIPKKSIDVALNFQNDELQ